MALLQVKKPARAANGTLLGAVPATAGGDSFPNTGSEFFYAKNSSVGSITLTFASPNMCNFELQSSAHNLTALLAAGEERIIGPFPVTRFNDSNALVQITYSGVTSLTVAPLAPA